MFQKNAKLTSLLSRKFFQKSNFIPKSRKMSTNEQDVIFQTIKNKGIITLNRQKQLNALNLSMIEKILPTLQQWEKEKTCVIIKGAGGKAFCAGGDVRAATEDALKGQKHRSLDFFKTEYIVNGIIGSYKIPYIALIDGIVMGGGVGLSVHGRYRIATEKTTFAMPETQIGFFADVGGSYFLSRLQGKLGLYLALTGQRLRGYDVYHAGIATHFCESDKLPDLEKALIDSDANKIAETIEKFHFNRGDDFSLAPYLEQIDKCFSAKNVEEIFDKLEEDASQWAVDTAKLLNKMSPTSLKLTFKELEVGSKLNLQQCLQMEYRIAVNCLNKKDFYEGVRALLVDKDQSPKWNPSDLIDVTDDLIDSHFTKLPEEQELKHKL